MIDRDHELALATQARLLGVARSTVYREPKPIPAADLAVMRRIDELHLDCPFAGSRMLRSMLVNEGVATGRAHVRTLLRRMGIEALCRRPRTSKAAPGHRIHPCLLRDVVVSRPNQVWAELAKGSADEVGGKASGGGGHHVHPTGAGIRLPRGGAGLV
jgi:putative transposase